MFSILIQPVSKISGGALERRGALRVVDSRETLARRLFFILLDVFISDILQYFVSSDPCVHLFVNSITWVITHSCMKVSRLISCQQAMYWFRRSRILSTHPSLHGFSSSLRGVARGVLGCPWTPLGRPSFEQTTYNIQVAKTPWQYLGRKSHCWKAHFFKICFFVKYFVNGSCL